MELRDLLDSGQTYAILPRGQRIRLTYDENGKLSNVSVPGSAASGKVTAAIRKLTTVPQVIAIKDGYTYVDCVAAPSSVICNGNVIDCDSDEVVDVPFGVWAYAVESLAVMFKGSVSQINWLNGAKFQTLNTFVMPALGSAESHKLHESAMYNNTFSVPVAGYYSYNTDTIIPIQYNIKVVSRVSNTRLPDGTICGMCTCADKSEVQVSWQELIDFDVHTGTLLYIVNDIVEYAYKTDNKKRDPVRTTVNCKVCGSPISADIPICSNPACMSTKYYDLVQLLDVLSLPRMPYDTYKQLCEAGKLLTLHDIFDIESYASPPTRWSLRTIMRAIVPYEIACDAVIDELVMRANNSADGVIFFANNPDKLKSFLDTNQQSDQLISWLTVPYNSQLVCYMLQDSNIVSDCADSKIFDGNPIFKDCTICVTGDFARGSLDDMKRLLSSFDATVVDTLSPDVNMVVTGDTMTSIDGSIIKTARANKIPVYSETQLFALFELDEMTPQNLLSDQD